MFKLRISKKQQALFFKRFSLYLRAGMPLLVSLDLLRTTTSSTHQKQLCSYCIEQIQMGKALSEALRINHSFDLFTIELIRTGEQSGTLSLVLEKLSLLLENRQLLEQKTLSVLMYPLTVFLATCGIAVFLVIYIFPKILPILQGLHAVLPWPTRFLVTISTSITHWWWLYIAVLALSISGAYSAVRTLRIRTAIEQGIIRIPFIRKMYVLHHLARLFLILSIAYESGLSILLCFEILERSLGSELYRRAVHQIRTRIEKGEKCSLGIKEFPLLFPHVSAHLIETGEDTGTLRQNLHALTTIYEHELATQVHILGTVTEPLLMVSMGFVVGTIALAMILPMYQLTGSLSG